MKAKILLLFFAVTTYAAIAQNADEIIYNQYLPQYSYPASSFVIDSGTSQVNGAKRAFLIWANNFQKDTLNRNLSLSEYDGALNFLTEQGGTDEKFGSVKNMFPKKIIKSKFERAYYLLAYVINSTHTINGFKTYSSPLIFKINANTLTLVWVKKINMSAINKVTVKTVIEYNDIIETRDKNIVLVGKYASSTSVKEYILATKLKSSTGDLMWRYTYRTGISCNEAANSVAETSDGHLSLTGYVKKCVASQNLSGNTDVFYMQLQSSGIPVAGASYERFNWPFLNMWADKITCYTTSPGQDRLIISGYTDIDTSGSQKQILALNLKQDGTLVTAHHIGNTGIDICNDLIFNKVDQAGNDYNIYLTGYTSNSQNNFIAQVYFLQAKFNANAGISGITEFSVFPNTLNTKGNRNGLEIKDAGNYKKFAILATGTYKPTSTTSATYSNVLVRDFNDIEGNCIKRLQVPFKQFGLDRTITTPFADSPSLKVYRESWTRLDKLYTKERCQSIKIDPSEASAIAAVEEATQQSALLKVSPNPANSIITVSTTNGKSLTGNNKDAVIRIYNAVSRLEKIVTYPEQQIAVRIPVSQLTPGIYRIQLIRGNETLGCSFLKE